MCVEGQAARPAAAGAGICRAAAYYAGVPDRGAVTGTWRVRPPVCVIGPPSPAGPGARRELSAIMAAELAP
jgi:hypothetical protein